MAQQGFIYKSRGSWFLKYRDDVIEDGRIVRKQPRQIAVRRRREVAGSDLDRLHAHTRRRRQRILER